MGRLSQALAAIAGCLSHPQLSVHLPSRTLLRLTKRCSAPQQPTQRKAEILCEASGVTMGDLIAIDYNWGELDIYPIPDMTAVRTPCLDGKIYRY